MATVLEKPTETQAVTEDAPALRLFTVAEYDKLAEAGILRPDERVELIEGRVVEMSPKSSRHAAATSRAAKCLIKRLGDRAILRVQDPIHLDDKSEPEPDIVLAIPQEREYADHHPTPPEILLTLEVAESSLHFNRQDKGLLYAKAGIVQYLVLNARARELEEYRQPSPDGYRSKQTHSVEQSFTLAAFPNVTMLVSELLPPE